MSSSELPRNPTRHRPAGATGVDSQVQRSRYSTLKRGIAIALIIGLAGYWIWEATIYVPPEQNAQASLPGQFVAAEASGQIPVGAEYPDYATNPPTSGPYWKTGTYTLPSGFVVTVPVQWGIYNQEIPAEALVGNMYRGGVVIWYNDQAGCDIMCLQALDLLVKPMVQDQHRIVLVPNHEMEHPVAATSWTRMLTLDQVDGGSILQFIQAHEGRFNPEHV